MIPLTPSAGFLRVFRAQRPSPVICRNRDFIRPYQAPCSLIRPRGKPSLKGPTQECRYFSSPGASVSTSLGYFRSKLAHRGRATTRQAGSLLLTSSERRRIAWHLPDDFDQRPPKQRADIVEWVRNVIISGSTEYRRYQCKVLRDRFFASISEPHESVPLRPPCASFRDPAAKVLSATSSKKRRGVWISRSGLAFSWAGRLSAGCERSRKRSTACLLVVESEPPAFRSALLHRSRVDTSHRAFRPPCRSREL